MLNSRQCLSVAEGGIYMSGQIIAPDESRPAGERLAWGMREFCEAFSISLDTAHRAAKSGALRTIRVCARRLIPAEEVARIAREGLQIHRGRPPNSKAPAGGNGTHDSTRGGQSE